MKSHKELTGASLFVFSTFIQRGLSFITTPLYTRLLSSYDYGIISTYNTWSGVLSVIFTLSIAANAFNTGLVRFKNDRNRFVGSMISLTAFLIFIGFVIVTLFARPIEILSGLEYKFYIIMFINMFFDVVYGFWGLCCKFDGKYVKVIVANLSISIISIAITISALFYFDGDAAFIKTVAGSVVSSIFAFVLTLQYLYKARCIILGEYWKYALTFCLPLVPHYMSNHLLNQADRIMITSMCGADKTAIYTIAYKMPEILNICWTCVSTVYVPWLYKKLDVNNYSEVKKINSIILGALSIITVGVTLLGPEIIWILATPEYQQGKYIVPVLVVGYYSLFICLICSHIELFYRKNKFITVITSTAAIVNIILNYIFIPMFGYMAAAYTTYIGYLIMLIMHMYNMKRLDLQRFINCKLLLLLFTVNSLIGFGIIFLYDYAVIRYGILVVLFIIILLRLPIPEMGFAP